METDYVLEVRIDPRARPEESDLSHVVYFTIKAVHIVNACYLFQLTQRNKD